MEFALGLLFVASVAGMLLGLIKPSLVLHWGQKRTRLRALGWYGLFAFLVFIAIGIFLPPPPQPVVAVTPSTSPIAPGKPVTDKAKEIRQAEEAQEQSKSEAIRKEAEANREKIAQETEANMAALAAKREEAKQPETPAPASDSVKPALENAVKARAEVEQMQQAEARAREADKAKIRAFEEELHGYDAISSLYMENAKTMTRRLGKDASLGDLYQALKQARQYAQAGANEVWKLRVPDVPEPVEEALKEAKEASWQLLLGRKDTLDAFMDWLDSRKPSDQAKMQEESNFSTLQAAKCVESLLKAKSRAGFTEEEITADLKKAGGSTSQQPQPANLKRGR